MSDCLKKDPFSGMQGNERKLFRVQWRVPIEGEQVGVHADPEEL